MRIEDLTNIKKLDIEKEIIEAIQDTKDELPNLTTDTTCMIYSDYLSRNLTKRHVINRIVSTSDYDLPYYHQFNIVSDNDKLYLIDLTFKQFQVSKLNELLQKGYMLVNTDTYGEYLDIVGNVNKEKEKQH